MNAGVGRVAALRRGLWLRDGCSYTLLLQHGLCGWHRGHAARPSLSGQSHRELEFKPSLQTLWDNTVSSMPFFLLLVTKENGVGGCSIDTVIDIRSNVFGDSVGFLHL